jgi:hypothetical protein
VKIMNDISFGQHGPPGNEKGILADAFMRIS